MPWMVRIATDYKDCLDQVRQFVQKEFAAGAVTPDGGNTGDGTVYGASATENSVAETWTLTCVDDTTSGAEVFEVSSPSEASYPDATVGVPYSQEKVSFIITQGDADFVSGDSFTFGISASTAEWEELRYTTGANDELILKGVGAGSDEVFVGYQTYTDSSAYWNWTVGGFTGYLAGNLFALQPGYGGVYTCLNNASFDFYCIFTSRHIKVQTILGSPGTSDGSYAGWFLPHATVSQYNYPMMVGGTTMTSNTVAGYHYPTAHSNYWSQAGITLDGAATLKVWDGTTIRPCYQVLPRRYGSFTNRRVGLDGKLRLYPASAVYSTEPNIYGVMEGVYWPTQYGPSGGFISSGDVIVGQVEGTGEVKATVVFHDSTQDAVDHYIALDLIGETL